MEQSNLMSFGHAGLRAVAAVGVAAMLGAWPEATFAADSWIEVRSPHFTVTSNAGESRARSVAWQFEQIRGAIEKGWPWAQINLDRPVHVIAVKDEASMKAMAPGLWEQDRNGQWSSLLTSLPDRHYILLRADLLEEDREGQNPYVAAYRSYSSLALHATFGPSMPLWFSNGLSGVLSNSIVRKNEIHFGRPLPDYVRQIQSGVRFRVPEILAMTSESPAYVNPSNRFRYDANAWGLVQYLLFGHPEGQQRFVQLVSLLAQRTPSTEALAQVYGPLDKLESANTNYQQIGYFTYGRLPVTSDVTRQKYPARLLPDAATAAARAGLHVAMRRPTEARARLEESLAADASLPDAHEIAGAWFDIDRKPGEAVQAFEKAAERGSENFYVYFRLASLRSQQPLDAAAAEAVQSWLDRAARLNARFAPTFATLSWLHESQRRLPLALEFAQRAVKNEPTDARYALRLAEVLARLSRVGDARTTAEQARHATADESVRRDLDTFLEALSRPSAAAAPPPPAGVAGAATASRDPGPDEPSEPASRTRALNPKDRTLAAPPPQTAGMLQQAPTLRKRVDPAFPSTATPGVDRGTVVVEIRIGPSGHVEAASIVGQGSTFDAAALEAVRQWEYEPTIVDGKPVTVIMSVPINFGF